MTGEGGPLDAKLSDILNRQQALEGSLAELVAEVLQFGCAFEVRRDSPNIVTLWRDREGEGANVEVQVIIKCGNAHEVRDDVWDALMNRIDMDVSTTDYANAVMERLGFPTPDGGWPK